MARINFADETYALDSLPADSKRLINVQAETMPADARSPYKVSNTPGLVLAYTLGLGPILAQNADLAGRNYIISGTEFWRMKPDGESAPEDLGPIGTAAPSPSGITMFPTIAVGVAQAVVCVPPNAFYCDHNSGPLTQITDPNFPGASSVTYMDGWFVFTSYEDDAKFFISPLLNAAGPYDALAFAYADGFPNVVRKIVQNKGNLALMGEAGIEFWYNAGLPNFPFTKRIGADISYGCGSPQSVVICDDSIFYLSFNGSIYRINGAQPVRVSTYPMEAWIRKNVDFTQVDACSFRQQGHAIYGISFTGANQRSYFYDCTEKRWHERASGSGGTGLWRARNVINRGGFNLAGDRLSGQLFSMDSSVNSDAGQRLSRIITLPPLWGGTKRAFMARAELEMQSGLAVDDTTVLLEISDDGGNTWRQRVGQTSGPAGDGRHRAFWTALGSYRQRILRFTINDLCCLFGADVEGEEGKW